VGIENPVSSIDWGWAGLPIASLESTNCSGLESPANATRAELDATEDPRHYQQTLEIVVAE
jgi:hypothetical protein